MPEESIEPSEVVTGVREDVLVVMRAVGTWAATPFLALIVLLGREHLDAPLVAEMGVHCLMVALSWTVFRRRFVALAHLLTAYVALVTLAATAHFGPLLGTGAMLVTGVAVAVFFHGLRAGLAVVALLAAGLGVIAWFATHGAPAGAYAFSGGAWARMTGTFVITALVTAVLVAYVLRGLLGAVAETEQARRREAKAHAERLEAERAFAEAQRHEALGRMASGIAHDVNNALTVVLTNAQILSRDLGPGTQRDAALDILDSGGAASDTIRQMLALTRRDVEKATVVSPAAVVEKMARSLRRMLPEHIEMVVTAAARGHVRVERPLLEQSILNLVLNARDAMPRGGRLSIAARDEEHLGERVVVIEVADTGTGMSDEVRRHIFEPFFTTKASERGTGLGLAMVSGFVERSGGTVEVESAEGAGATFRLALPASSEPAAQEAEVEHATCAGARILVLEDDERVRRSLREALRSAGATVFAASSVTAAREMLRMAGDVDVLCTDAVLPDGVALAGFVSEMRARGGAKIVVCTGHDPRELATIQVGPEDALLRKPFSASQLVSAVAALTRK